jgi:hypothetical protein
VVRREWTSLAIALGATAAVVVASFILMPDAWRTWPQVLANNVGKNGTWAAVPIPFIVRLPFALLLVVWGARKNHRWTVPVSAMIALPALWYGGLSILIATLPLVGARSWSDLVRVLAEGRAEIDAWFAGVRRRGGGRASSPAASRLD